MSGGTARGGQRWWQDLTLGARLAFNSGRGGWGRLSLIALGVGIGVAVLLLAASVPNMVAERAERLDAASPVVADDLSDADSAVLLEDVDTYFRSEMIGGQLIQPHGAQPPVPPGLEELPSAGEMYVSPALADILESPDGDLLDPRLDYEVAGVIGQEGLSGPGELQFYIGSDDLDDDSVVVTDFGNERSDGGEIAPEMMVLLAVAIVILVLPVALFVAVAMRFGGERRNQRLAALRLIGLERGAAKRVAAGEALVGAVLGLVVGAIVFATIRQFAASIEIMRLSAFPSDLTPATPLAAILAAGVPVMSVLAAVFQMRHVAVEPLSVARAGSPTRRRLWWRLLLITPGLAVLGFLASRGFDPGDYLFVAAATALLLLGLAALLPWLADAVIGRMNGGSSLARQLAVRRLQHDGGGIGRLTGGLVVVVAGGIALQVLLSGAGQQWQDMTATESERTDVVQADASVSGNELQDRVNDVAGVQASGAYYEATITTKDAVSEMVVAECDVLLEITDASNCSAADAFTANPAVVPAGENAEVEAFNRYSDDPFNAEQGTWTVPQPSQTVELAPQYDDLGQPALLVTPETLPQNLLETLSATVMVTFDDGVADVRDKLRNAVEPAPVNAEVSIASESGREGVFAQLERAIQAGVVILMLVTGLNLLVSTVEQLQERRRVLTVLRAEGTSRRVLTSSVVWQSAIPVLVGLVIAGVAGTGLGMLLLRMGSMNPVEHLNWGTLAASLGVFVVAIFLAVVTLVSLLSVPLLWRLTRSDGLRSE